MTISTAEKIETIVNTRRSGNFGEYHDIGNGAHRVVVDGKTYIVSHEYEWKVSCGARSATGDLLIYAAMDCVKLCQQFGAAGVTRF